MTFDEYEWAYLYKRTEGKRQQQSPRARWRRLWPPRWPLRWPEFGDM